MSNEKKMNNPLKKISPNKKAKPVGKPEPKTRAQKIFRGPLFWIIVAIFAVSIFGQISSAANRYTVVTTSQALDAIAQSNVKSALLIDKDQKIQLILKEGKAIKGATKVEASYVIRQEPTIVDALTANPPAKGWDVDVAPLLIWSDTCYRLLALPHDEQRPRRESGI
jgi:cell division protease FtsH